MAAAGVELLVLDTRARHEHAGGYYASRRRACEQAAALLGVPALRDVDRPRPSWTGCATRCCGAGPGTSSPRTSGC